MKTLIVVRGDYNPNIGGPAGYVSKLKLGLKDSKYVDFIFLKKTTVSSHIQNPIKRLLKKHLPSFLLPSFLLHIFRRKHFKQLIKELQSVSFEDGEIEIIEKKLNIQEYDFVHCHRAEEMVMMSKLINSLNYETKKILTLHNPIKPSLEQFDSNQKTFGNSNAKKIKDHFGLIENKSLEVCDAFIFPCKEAISYYFNTWKEFICISNEKPIKYILTGTQPQTFRENKENIRIKYNIPNEAFVFSFVGRHIEVKGYDILKEAARWILDNNENVYFIIGGIEFPLKGIKHPRWIEVGWTNDPGSIINCSDVFILPNRETYFDLVMLETMSLGKVVLASNTGGNKKVAETSSGILLVEPSADELRKSMIDLITTDKSILLSKGESNAKTYYDNYSLDSFAKGYLKTICELVS